MVKYVFQSHVEEKIFQNLQVSRKLSIREPMQVKLFVAFEIQYFELRFFSFNSYVYYVARGFIASTHAFNLLTGAFNLPTRRAFNLASRVFSALTCGFELLNCEFELVNCRFQLATRGFELATRGFGFITYGFEVVTRNSCFTFPHL